MDRTILLISLLVLSPLRTNAAEEPGPLKVGDLVRVQLLPPRAVDMYEGTLTAVWGETMWLKVQNPATFRGTMQPIAIASVVSLMVWRDGARMDGDRLLGALVGATIMGIAAARSADCSYTLEAKSGTTPECALISGVFGAIEGALVGPQIVETIPPESRGPVPKRSDWNRGARMARPRL